MTGSPSTRDGRNLDRRIADEHGEAATLEIDTPADQSPLATEPAPMSDTYYDLPVVKAAPWRWYVPAYFYAGGLGGAAATLALTSSAREAPRLHWIASIAEGTGAALLIADLGKPLRALNMMRVFRPTSPMNMGTWILSIASASGGLSLLRPNRALSAVAAASGSMLATYTAVLLGNTAIPLWHRTRRVLPLYFAASSAASLACVLELLGTPRKRYSMIAKTVEVAGAVALERVGGPVLRDHAMWRRSKWLGFASLAATALGRPRLAGVLGTASAILGRFAIVDAGKASARDPRETFAPQRR